MMRAMQAETTHKQPPDTSSHWLRKAWDWAYKHGLTPANKRFWGIVLTLWGLSESNDTATKAGAILMGYGDARAFLSRDRDSTIDTINRAYKRTRNHNTGGPND